MGAINGIISEELTEKSMQVLVDSLKATKRVRSGRGEYSDVPDYSTRLKAAELLVAYAHGRPANTSRNLNLNVSESRRGMSEADIIRQLASGGDVDSILEKLKRKSGNGSLSVSVAVNDDAVVDV
jgi:hypothetical protein